MVIPLFHFIIEGNWLEYGLIDAVLIVLYILGLVWFYNYIFVTLNNGKMGVAKSTPRNELGLDYKEFQLITPNGHPIKGWYIPAKEHNDDDHPVIIYSHGFGLSREQLGEVSYRQFDFFIKRGYSIITFDYPIGDRDGSHKVTGGALESEDLATVIKYAKNNGHQFICLMGYSYGGNTTLYYALNKVQPLADAIVLDSSSVFTPDIIAKQLQVWSGVPSLISRLFLPILWKRQTGYSWISHPMQNVFTKKIDSPVLFWHGTSDRDAFYEVIKNIFANQIHSLTDFKTVQEGKHIELYTIIGEDMYNQVTFEWMEKVRELLSTSTNKSVSS